VFNEEVLTVAVSTLRKALDDNPQGPEYLKTLPAMVTACCNNLKGKKPALQN